MALTRTTRTAVVVGVAVTTALVASVAAYQAVSHLKVRQVEVASVFVVAAARPLATGTLITDSDLRLIGWPSQTPLPGAFATTDMVVGRGLVSAVIENEPVLEGKLAPREAGAGLPPTIPHGMRALAVRVNELIGVAGFVVPGTHVDVVATIRLDQTNVTRVVASNILVMAAGTLYDTTTASAESTPIPATVVTLLVTPLDAQRIALAGADGQIVLTLRNPLDTATTTEPGINTAELVGAPMPAQALAVPAVARTPAPRAPPAPPRPYSVEVFRGLERTQETVR